MTCVTLGGSSIPFEWFPCLNPSLSRLEQDKITGQARCSYENTPLRLTLLMDPLKKKKKNFITGKEERPRDDG